MKPFLFITLLFIVSCSDDDNEQPITDFDLLIGTWDIQSRSINNLTTLEALNGTLVFSDNENVSDNTGILNTNEFGIEIILDFELSEVDGTITFIKENGEILIWSYILTEDDTNNLFLNFTYIEDGNTHRESWKKTI